jgi:hypothetical protein
VGQVNKTLADILSYVRGNAIGRRDSYTPAAASGTIKGARLWEYINVKGAGVRGLALTTESGAVDDIGTTQLLQANTDQFISKDLGTDPNTSALVTLTNLNGMKHGQKIIS